MIIRMQGITKMHTSMEDDIFCIGYIFSYSFSYFIYLVLHQTISIFKRISDLLSIPNFDVMQKQKHHLFQLMISPWTSIIFKFDTESNDM